MRHRRLLRYHGLKRPKLRQTWNKYNLYNLARFKVPNFLTSKTYFQQKWYAKSTTRPYHGEHIREGQWERMFSRRLRSVVNMDPAYMARHDGSEQAAGRGSGLEVAPGTNPSDIIRNRGNRDEPTPYMQMAFAAQERRLDIAVFRAMFASSARQARQFVLHGAVTVNGKRMRHPQYLLNPGDMFQVNPERVLMATGMPKRPTQGGKSASSAAEEGQDAAEEAEETAEASAEEASESSSPAGSEAAKKHREALLALKDRAKRFMVAKSDVLRAKHKKAIRKILREIKTSMSKAGSKSQAELDAVEAELAELVDNLTLSPAERRAKLDEQQKKAEELDQERLEKHKANPALLTPAQLKVIQHLAKEEAENPYDPSKPYATPWRPRDWMPAFAFIPRYLEVNHKICAAVYLRHPVARPGSAEVPTPFPPMLNQLAFNWYLKRR
ncbi:hypothetical protein VTJ04DRAFT_4785 [Mycothermus thermophilus]|uniref:mitochondrial 37S ribosomal protein uS4m n=1 Tax=Humicola insolens TaxID=85995 RepID=UPI003743AC8C